MRTLRRRLALPLGSEEAGGRSCRPWVEAVSANWLFEEPHAIAPPQVRVCVCIFYMCSWHLKCVWEGGLAAAAGQLAV